MPKPPRDFEQQRRDILACLPGTSAQIVERSGWCLRIVAETLKYLSDAGKIRKTWRKGDRKWVYRRTPTPDRAARPL